MKYVRTKDRIVDILDTQFCEFKIENNILKTKYYDETFWDMEQIITQADTIEELCDEIVLIENGNEHNVVYLQEAFDRIDEYHNQDNYEPRLIGRIKVGFDKKAVAEWKENEQGLYDWVLL